MDTDDDGTGVTRGLVVGLLLAVLLAATPPSAAAEEVSPSDALAAKERATDLRSELRTLDEREEVDVDEDVLATVDREIEKGRLTVDSGEYAEAKRHFKRATEQARAELARGYAEGTATLLNGTDNYLRSLRAQGYETAEIGVLGERITEQRGELERADDLASSRSVYGEARSIRADADDLPRPGVVRAVGLLASFWWLLPVAALLVIALAGWYVRTSNGGDDGPQLH